MDINEKQGSVLDRYLAEFPNIPGFFTKEAMGIWDFLLSAQAQLGIAGDFLEIGVYKGRSAVLGAMHLAPDEACVMVDINPVPETEEMIRSVNRCEIVSLHCTSSEAAFRREILDRAGQFRWVHIDGDHTAYSTMQDLQLAASVLASRGIICVDDFFSFRYPQLTAAVYRFLFDHAIDFRMLFAGSNKCYLCRGGAYAEYESVIRAEGPAVCERLNRQLQKSSYASDWGCFSETWKLGDAAVWGRDEDPSRIFF